MEYFPFGNMYAIDLICLIRINRIIYTETHGKAAICFMHAYGQSGARFVFGNSHLSMARLMELNLESLMKDISNQMFIVCSQRLK